MMAKDGPFDNSFHKCSFLDDEYDPTLSRYILTCNPFQISLVDTVTHEVFALARIKASQNYMNESLSIITGGLARFVTFKTKEGDLILNFMFYDSGRTAVRKIVLPRGLLSSLRWRAL